MLEGLLDVGDQRRPRGLPRVEQGCDAPHGVGLGELTVLDRQRGGFEVVPQPGDGGQHLVLAAAEHAGLLSAPLGEVAQRQVEAHGLDHRVVVADVDSGVEHDASDLVGEQFGIGGADLGAVGVAEEVQAVVVHQAAQQVEVAHRFDGGDVVEQVAAVLPAGVGELGRRPQQVRPLLLGVGRGVQVVHRVGPGRVVAPHRGGVAGAARIPADDVVLLQAGAAERVDEFLAGTARTARVDEQGAEAGGRGRGQLLQREGERLGARIGVVQRREDVGADRRATAVRPAQPLVEVAAQPGAGGRVRVPLRGHLHRRRGGTVDRRALDRRDGHRSGTGGRGGAGRGRGSRRRGCRGGRLRPGRDGRERAPR